METLVYNANKKIIFQFESAIPAPKTAAYSSKDTGSSSPKEKDLYSSFSLGELAPWGASNSYPQEIKEIILKNNTLSWCFRQLVSSIFSSGIAVKKKLIDPVSKEVKLVDSDFPEWNEFIRRNRKINSHQFQKLRDLQRFGVSPVEFIHENGKIVGIKAHKATHFRRSLQNEYGVSENAYLNAQWHKGAKVEDNETIKMKIVPDDFDAVDLYKLENPEGNNSIYVIQVPSDETYYPVMDWTSIVNSGWLEISNNEPRLVKAIIENKAIVNYVIKIKDWYWSAKYPEWNTWKVEKKKEKRKETLDEFNKMIAGIDQAGKTMLMDVITQLNEDIKAAVKGKTLNYKDTQDAWELTTVPNNDFSGSLKTDADTARKETMLAIGVDVSSFGSVPEQNHQGGSGKSQSMNILIIVTEFMRQLSIQDFEFIRDYNEWDPNMIFTYTTPVMQTLANVTPSQRDLQIQK